MTGKDNRILSLILDRAGNVQTGIFRGVTHPSSRYFMMPSAEILAWQTMKDFFKLKNLLIHLRRFFLIPSYSNL